MYEKELFDETLDINSTNNYEISIQLGLNGFSFSILDSLRKRFVMFRDYKLNGKDSELADQIIKIVSHDEFLEKEYRKTRIIFNFERSTIVPASLYDPALKDNYFTLNHSLKDDHIVANNKLDKPDSYLIFDIRQDAFDTLCSRFPEASLSHQLKPLIDSAFRKAQKLKSQYINVHVNNGFFILTIIDNNELRFINSFRVRNDSDILYYLMNSFNRFNISGDQAVWLSGNINKFDDLYNNMLRYIKTLKFAEPEGDFSLSYIFDEMGTHQYSNLFNIVNCA